MHRFGVESGEAFAHVLDQPSGDLGQHGPVGAIGIPLAAHLVLGHLVPDSGSHQRVGAGVPAAAEIDHRGPIVRRSAEVRDLFDPAPQRQVEQVPKPRPGAHRDHVGVDLAGVVDAALLAHVDAVGERAQRVVGHDRAGV